MKEDASSLTLFLGHFHPLLVHLPIGGLIVLAFLELVARRTRWKDAAQSSCWVLGFAAGVAGIAATCGWMLAQAGGYDVQLLKWHRALGLGVTAASFITLLLRQREWFRAYRVSLVATLLLLVAASHLGGSITHGRDFLTRYAPGFPSVESRAVAMRAVATSPLQQPVFASVIEPILRRHCVACHGSEKHKADLRLDDVAAWLSRDQKGVVVRGRAKESLLMQRLLVPLDGEGHMPPDGQQQPSPDEIALLEWWINAGAPTGQTAVDLHPGPEIQLILARGLQR